MGKHLLAAAIVAYLLAWPLPSFVIRDTGPFAPYTHVVRGWEATRWALRPVWPQAHASVDAGWFRQALMVTSALTNLLFVTAALVAVAWPQRVTRGLAVAVWIAALVNLHWWLTSSSDRLAERRSGYVIILLGSLLGLAVPVLHMMGKGVGGEIAKSSGAFFFIWTIIALGVTALFSVILSVRGLWSLQWRRPR